MANVVAMAVVNGERAPGTLVPSGLASPAPAGADPRARLEAAVAGRQPDLTPPCPSSPWFAIAVGQRVP